MGCFLRFDLHYRAEAQKVLLSLATSIWVRCPRASQRDDEYSRSEQTRRTWMWCNRFPKLVPLPSVSFFFLSLLSVSRVYFLEFLDSVSFVLSWIPPLAGLGSFRAVLFAVCLKATVVELFLPARLKLVEFVTASKYLDVLRFLGFLSLLLLLTASSSAWAFVTREVAVTSNLGFLVSLWFYVNWSNVIFTFPIIGVLV